MFIISYLKSMYHDAHCHLSKNSMYSKLQELRKKWEEVEVTNIQSVATTLTESYRSLSLYEKGIIFPGVGKHPWKAKEALSVGERESFEKMINDSRCFVIGEVGLDHHFITKTDRYIFQQELFDFFVSSSLKTGKPLNVHSKGAEKEVYQTLYESNIDGKRVNVHWFSGSEEDLFQLAKLGCYFSIGPAVNYSTHKKVAELIPIEQLLTETDGDMKYKPLGGVKGEPALIPQIVGQIAIIKNLPYKDTREILYENAMTFLKVQ